MKYIYIILLSLLAISCGKTEKNSKNDVENNVEEKDITVTQSQFDSEKMELGMLSEQAFNESIITNGMIDVPPQNKASVRSFLGGYIKQSPLLIGDKVKKGQRLATLENTEFVEIQQEYLEISEQLNYLKSEFERQKTLFDEKITSQKNYLKAQSTYKSALATYNGLRKKLTMMHINPVAVEKGNISASIHIYAPIEGFVTKVNVSNGTYVSPSDEILEIIDTDHIHLELSVFEKDILKIKKGQPIYFKIPESSTEIYDAEVHLVGTSIDANRTVKIHGHIKNEKQTNFVTGMFVEAEIVSSSKLGMALPKDAVTTIEGSSIALVLNDKNEQDYTFKKVIIELGNQNEKYIEVLNKDDFKDKKILTKGGFMLLIE